MPEIPQIPEIQTISGEEITKNIEGMTKSFWEILSLDVLLDMFINFVHEIWGWIKTVFEGLIGMSK